MMTHPRMLAVSLAVALVVGVGGGIVLSRVLTGDGVDVSLDEPGVYPVPAPEQLSVIGDRLPDVEVHDVDGDDVATGTLRGQPLVVYLWNSSCEPCMRQLPAIAEVSDEHAAFLDAVGANFPMTLFVAADGTVVDQTGELDADGLRSRLDAML